ncbi:MAG: 2-C-methyl-D-erythritol 4-phosphate cytidylyltransferase, partial [Propionibacteriaceae bacterium]|nr:2-C-methyl-D-erythritol 4-phosphate cytidylyltransferase [Propionibacteriaceae bacterium]
FRYGRLLRAHEAVAETGTSVTDDAAAVELDGGVVHLVEGDHRAMKVTGPFDLDCVRLVLEGETKR